MSDWQYAQSNDSHSTFPETKDTASSTHSVPSVLNLEKLFNNNTKYATQSVLPPDDYHSPYYLPFKNVDDPRPVNQLVYRFSIWKMIIKQLVFYFKEMAVFKQQTGQGNRAMLENLEVLRKQNSGRLRSRQSDDQLQQSDQQTEVIDSDLINKLLQTTFLPPGDGSVLSISTTFFNTHNMLREREQITYQQLTNRLIPRLENLKDQLNETIKQMNSIKNSSDFKTKNLKMEIAKTGAILSDYITSIELLKTGHSKSSLGTTLTFKEDSFEPRNDPYILKLKLDLQLKDQLYIEAHLKEMYYDLQYKAVQLEKILYTEIQTCISSYTDLIDAELNSVKDNLVAPLQHGLLVNEPTIDWDYFIRNDRRRNFLPLDARTTLARNKVIRKNSDIIYPYRNNVISSCVYSGYLDRKSKYLKNYSKFYYVLTINFLHEFKSSDRIKDLNPIQSFPLNFLTVATVENDERKFIVRIAKPSGKVKYTFKAENAETADKWIDYLSDLADFESAVERNLSYDVSEDDENQIHEPHPPVEDSFANSQSITTSPAHTPEGIKSAAISHSRSVSDDYFRSQRHQVQQSLQESHSQTHLTHTPVDDAFSHIAFRSVKAGNNSTANSSSSSLHSRSSSRVSSRASSPAARLRSSLLSPKASPSTTPTSTTPTSSTDYFSYAPRKVQAAIIRNNNRLGTPTTPLASLNTHLPVPRINVQESTPTAMTAESAAKTPTADSTSTSASASAAASTSGLERRRLTLSQQLEPSSSSSSSSPSLIKMPTGPVTNHNLPETPGVIPGSRMNVVFESHPH
ncbi:hypothetical protein CANINC_004970 [Pichia inconspicua]|uniref:PH domain-containing protein n=1 Tax=Pichia inconspicua TaxID=52247 RepID=A0A4T0WUP0_9ASCO|nr:hypothetical protein CANINC_004970 [[Candida] inconspicua]